MDLGELHEVCQGKQHALAAELGCIEALSQLHHVLQAVHREAALQPRLAQLLEAVQHVLVRRLQHLLSQLLRNLHIACRVTMHTVLNPQSQTPFVICRFGYKI